MSSITELTAKHQYITLMLVTILSLVFIGLRIDKVFADSYLQLDPRTGVPDDPVDNVENTIGNRCAQPLSATNGPHTYHPIWAGPYYLTPSYAAYSSGAWQDISIYGSSYICPGVAYGGDYNIKFKNLHTDPTYGVGWADFTGTREIDFTNGAVKGVNYNWSDVESIGDYRIHFAGQNGCYNDQIDYTVDDTAGGPHNSGSYVVYICIIAPTPNLQCDNLENSVGTDLDGATINQGTTVTLDMPFTNFGNAPVTMWYANGWTYVIWLNVTYPNGGSGGANPIFPSPGPTSLSAYGGGSDSLNAYQSFTFSQAGTYTFNWFTTNKYNPAGGNGNCSTTITVVPPPPNFQCQGASNDGLISNPSVVVAGQSFYVTMPSNNTQPYSVATFSPLAGANSIEGYSIVNPNGVIVQGPTAGPISPNPEYGVGTVTINTSSTPIVNPMPGTWKINWLVSAAGGLASCSATVQVYTVSDPYTAAWGGDVIAGSEFNNGSGPGACPSSTNTPTDPAGYYPSQNAGIIGLGGTTNAAAEAYATISGFDSNYNSPGGSFTAMTFANISNAFGHIGDFGYAPCAPSYALPASAPALNPTITWPGPGSGTTVEYWTGGTLNTTPETIWPGEQLTIYVVSGASANIDANISYSNAAYTSASDVPSFTLVALGGNINVASSTTEVDGTYVAKPVVSGATANFGGNYVSGGTIYDCTQADGTAYPSPLPPPSTAYTNYDPACFSQLYIRGSFVARQIAFDRIYDPGTANGGLSASPSGTDTPTNTAAAEDFEYGPAQWIATPANSSINDNYYDSITSLPPIL